MSGTRTSWCHASSSHEHVIRQPQSTSISDFSNKVHQFLKECRLLNENIACIDLKQTGFFMVAVINVSIGNLRVYLFVFCLLSNQKLSRV